jgi:hypothetical protein
MQAIISLLSPQAWWGLAAAIPAVLAELAYKKWPTEWPWWWGLPLWLPMQLAIGYCIFRLVTVPNSGSLLDAFIFWAFSTTFLRVIVTTLVLQQTVQGGTWFALALLCMARVSQTFWGR